MRCLGEQHQMLCCAVLYGIQNYIIRQKSRAEYQTIMFTTKESFVPLEYIWMGYFFLRMRKQRAAYVRQMHSFTYFHLNLGALNFYCLRATLKLISVSGLVAYTYIKNVSFFLSFFNTFYNTFYVRFVYQVCNYVI